MSELILIKVGCLVVDDVVDVAVAVAFVVGVECPFECPFSCFVGDCFACACVDFGLPIFPANAAGEVAEEKKIVEWVLKRDSFRIQMELETGNQHQIIVSRLYSHIN